MKSKLRRLIANKRTGPLAIALGIALLVSMLHVTAEAQWFSSGFLSRYGFLHQLDLRLLDLKFRNRPEGDLPLPEVVVAAIDEKSVDRFGLWPWRRSVIADFIDAATKGGARVIAFDATFSETDRNASFKDIQGFLEAFDAEGLGGDSQGQKRLEATIGSLVSAKEKQDSLLATLEKRSQGARTDKAIKAAVRQARKAQQVLGKALKNTRSELDALLARGRRFRDKMEHVVVSGSPDEALAAALRRSPQTVMGFFDFDSIDDVVGVDIDALDAQAEFVMDKASIDTIFEEVVHDYGFGTAPAPFDMEKLWVHESEAMRAPIPVIGEAAANFGYFNARPDTDGVVRQLRMLHKYKGKLLPALSLSAAARYFDAEVQPLDGLIRPGTTLSGIRLGSFEDGSSRIVPTDDRGHFIINFYKNPVDYFPVIPVADFIDGSADATLYKDKIVIFGMTALGLFDQPPTPFSSRTPGVYVHAASLQNMVDNQYIVRPPEVALFEILGYLLLGLLIGLVLPRLPPWAGAIAVLILMIGFVSIDIRFVFANGLWLKTVPPLFLIFFSLIGIYLHGFLTEGREKRKIRKAFQFYLTKSVVDEMLKQPEKLQLGGERRTCTVLFSDIRGFTSISEALTPEELSNLLNEYLTPMTNLVFDYDGTLDKYMGDAIMAIFGAPVAYEDHARRACFAAIEMMEELVVLQKGWRARGVPELDIGIGLNTGPMSVGNMGSEVRFDYTVMGDNVNLGSRLEGINKQYGTNIIISEYTYAACRDQVHVREIDAVRVKGRNEPVVIHELIGKGTASAEAQAFIDDFHAAIALYKNQQWQEAMDAFNGVLSTHNPGDVCSTNYIKRCEQMQADPPGANWDGVYTMTTK